MPLPELRGRKAEVENKTSLSWVAGPRLMRVIHTVGKKS